MISEDQFQNGVSRKLTISVEEASDLLGIGRSLGYKLAREGDLPGVMRLGRRLVVSKSVIQKVLDEGRIPGAA